MFLENCVNKIKVIIHYVILVFLGIMALMSIKGVIACKTYNADENGVALLCTVCLLIAIWMMISGILTGTDEKYYKHSLICFYLGHLFVMIIGAGNVTEGTVGYRFFDAVSSSSAKTFALLDPFWEAVGARLFLLFFLALIILMAIVLSFFTIRAFVFFILLLILCVTFPESVVALIIGMVVAVGLIIRLDGEFIEKVYSQKLERKMEVIGEKADNGFFDLKRPQDWMFLALCILGVFISFITGKVSGWLNYMQVIFSDDYSGALGLSQDMAVAVILSFLVSMSVSSSISIGIKIFVNKKSNSILVTVSSVLLDSLINIWLLDKVVDIVVRVVNGEKGFFTSFVMSMETQFNKSVFEPFVENLPLWAQFICYGLYILFFLALYVGAAVLTVYCFYKAGASLVKGLVFIFVANLVSSYVHLNIAEMSSLAAFIILYLLNMVVSGLVENMEGFWSAIGKASTE